MCFPVACFLSLSDYIMGGPIGYSSTDTGTRQPVVIVLRPADSDAVQCWLAGEEVSVQELQARMKNIMSSQGERISSHELEVELAVPRGVHAVFVDLPGIKDDSKDGAAQTRSVVRTYVQNNPNDLYILVKKASDDPANWPWSLREFILSAPPKGRARRQFDSRSLLCQKALSEMLRDFCCVRENPALPLWGHTV